MQKSKNKPIYLNSKSTFVTELCSKITAITIYAKIVIYISIHQSGQWRWVNHSLKRCTRFLQKQWNISWKFVRIIYESTPFFLYKICKDKPRIFDSFLCLLDFQKYKLRLVIHLMANWFRGTCFFLKTHSAYNLTW